MALSDQAQALFDHAKQSLPRWLTNGKNTAVEWLYAFVGIFDSARTQAQDWLDITYFDNASGLELDQHALDRGTVRRSGESDVTLRERLRNISDVVTEPALKTAIDAILAASGLGPCTFLNLRRDRAYFHTTGLTNAFLSRGYRITTPQFIMSYTVILPFGTTAQIGSAVREYLRQYGPGGYNYFVEIRGVP